MPSAKSNGKAKEQDSRLNSKSNIKKPVGFSSSDNESATDRKKDSKLRTDTQRGSGGYQLPSDSSDGSKKKSKGKEDDEDPKQKDKSRTALDSDDDSGPASASSDSRGLAESDLTGSHHPKGEEIVAESSGSDESMLGFDKETEETDPSEASL